MALAALVFMRFGGFGTGENVNPEEFLAYAEPVENITVPESAKIIALGEATHGNAEFQQLKLEVFKQMVKNNGVTTVSNTVSNTATEDAATEKKDDKDVQVIAEGKSLVIPVSDISSTASFYPVEVEGTRMEVLAVADSEGNIRTAFNTCQICYGSGRGYYVQEGNVLVCQNCGNRFTVDQVEIQSGGCNPWPIFPENKTITGDTIEISYDFLNESKEIFSNWRTQY